MPAYSIRRGPELPSNPRSGKAFIKNAGASQGLYVCLVSGTWVGPLSTGGGGITNDAGENVITKSDGTNVVASRITDNGTDINANSGTGKFQAGDLSAAGNSAKLVLNDVGTDLTFSVPTAGAGTFNAKTPSGSCELGDVDGDNFGYKLEVSDVNQRVRMGDVGGDSTGTSMSILATSIDASTGFGNGGFSIHDTFTAFDMSFNNAATDFEAFKIGTFNAAQSAAGTKLLVAKLDNAIKFSVRKDGAVVQGAPAATTAADLANGQISFWLDQVANKLMVAVRYSDGTTKTGEVALT